MGGKDFHRKISSEGVRERWESWENVKRSDLLFDNDMFMGKANDDDEKLFSLSNEKRWRKFEKRDKNVELLMI